MAPLATRMLLLVSALAVVACSSATDESSGDPAPLAGPSGEPAPASPSNEAVPPPDADPDASADPAAPSPADDPATPPATQADLVRAFAPHVHLHPDDAFRPANIDWYLARATLRFAHPGCATHEILALGKVTQATLADQSHASNVAGTSCAHDSAKVVKSTASDAFYLDLGSSETIKRGAPRADWKTYAVWRPRSMGGLVDVEYWTFYPWNDGFAIFDHPSDWENVRVTIDPKANGGRGAIAEVRFSEHKGGTILKAGDAKLALDGTHPVSFIARGTHANYPQPGTYDIPDTYGIAKDEAKRAPAADVWKQETSVVAVGTRAAPKNGQLFVKFWGRWGAPSDLPESSGVTRHFP